LVDTTPPSAIRDRGPERVSMSSTKAGKVVVGVAGTLFLSVACCVCGIVANDDRPARVTSTSSAGRVPVDPSTTRPPDTRVPPSDREADPTTAQVARLNDPATMGQALIEWRASSVEVPYGSLERGADTYAGQQVIFRGRVVEIHDRPNGGSWMRIATRGSYANIYWVESLVRAPPSVTARASVLVVGKLAGTFTYQSQSGWNITLPAALAYAVIPASEASSAERAAARAARTRR